MKSPKKEPVPIEDQYRLAIAATLRMLRQRLGTQTAMARKAREAGLRLTQSTIGQWERGDQKIGAARLLAYLSILSCSAARFGELVDEERQLLQSAATFDELKDGVEHEVRQSARATKVLRRLKRGRDKR